MKGPTTPDGELDDALSRPNFEIMLGKRTNSEPAGRAGAGDEERVTLQVSGALDERNE